MKNSLIKLSLVITLAVFFIKISSAHDPGLSTLELKIEDSEIKIRVSFSLADIQSVQQLTGLDQQSLFRFFKNAIQLTGHDQTLNASSIDTFIEPNDNVSAKLTFNNPGQHNNLNLSIPLLKYLPRGHRQYVVINNNGTVYRKVISANSKPLTMSKLRT